jgi:hypothetical protein
VRTTPGDAEIAIDGVAPLRPGRSLPVAPGAHRVAARSPGFVAREISVDVIAGDGFEVSIVLAPVAAPPRASPPASSHEPPPRPTPWPGLALGAAGVAAAVGAYYGRAALDRWNTVRDHCPGGTCTSSADLALADRARRDGRVADVAVAVSGIALVGAFLLWRTPARGATVAAAGAGAMVGWQGSF